MSARPRIGIALGLERRSERIYQILPRAYSDAISAARGIPLLLPVAADPDALLSGVQGLVIPGGGDFAPPPGRYPPGVFFDPVLPEQEAHDRALFARARDRALPVLGICYGMQRIALCCGGTLYHDLGSDCPQAGEHRSSNAAGHEICVEANSHLARALGCDRALVNTHHHQAVRDPGPELRVSARAPDGVIEAIEAPGAPFCLGVQWHPEREETAADRALIRCFVEHCTARA